jgi:hypothetical protein
MRKLKLKPPKKKKASDQSPQLQTPTEYHSEIKDQCIRINNAKLCDQGQ